LKIHQNPYHFFSNSTIGLIFSNYATASVGTDLFYMMKIPKLGEKPKKVVFQYPLQK